MAKLERAITEFREAWEEISPEVRSQAIESLKETIVRIRDLYKWAPPKLRSALANLALMVAKEEFSPFGMGGENAVTLVFKRLGVTEKEVGKCLL